MDPVELRRLNLPSNLESERQVLGAMMASVDAVGDAVDLVRPEDFYSSQHRILFETITALYQRQSPSDPVAVVEELRRAGRLEDAGGAINLADIAQEMHTASGARHHAKIVSELAVLRRLAQASGEIQDMVSGGGDPAEIADRAESLVYEARGRKAGESWVQLSDSLSQTLDEVEAIANGTSSYLGMPTGFRDLDSLLGGFYPDNLIVLAARPGIGKSALAVNIARNVAIAGKTVALFSLEMSHSEVSSRLLCAEAQVALSKLRQGRVADEDWSRLAIGAERLANLPIRIYDSGSLNLLTLRASARRLAHERLGLIVVDYLQLMAHHRRVDSRQQEVAEITRGLKLLAKELHIPVIAISQLNRELERRGDKRPMLSDLRESGAIEQDADVVMFLHRDVTETDPPVELIVAKHRNGPIDTIRLRWSPEVTRFQDWHTVAY
jgi:replicative DNA helicase